MIHVYGIKNCDTVKKAVSWLNRHHIEYEFFDLKTCGITLKKIEGWREAIGADALINKRSTTWKQLSQADQDRVLQPQGLAIVLANPSLIKRPLVELNDKISVGFSEAEFTAFFNLPT
jgi:arsenate reductase